MIFRAIISVAFASVGVTSCLADDLLKVAVGQRGQWESAIPELGSKKGIFAKHGIALDILYTQGTGETQQVVISGSADIGSGLNIFGVLATSSKGAPIRILGTSMKGVNDLFWYVKADSGIKSMRVADGVSVGFSTGGSSFQMAARTFERVYNVKYRLVQTGSIPATYAQVQTGQIDVGFSAIPTLLDAESEGKIKVIGRGSELASLSSQTFRVLAVNAGALVEKRDAIARFVQAYKETADWLYSDPDAITAYAKHAGVSIGAALRVKEITPRESIEPDVIAGAEDIINQAKVDRQVDQRFDLSAFRALLAPNLAVLSPH